MNPVKLDEIQVANLDVFTNGSDLRHDAHAFVDYARTHEIKRGHRGNGIPATHQQRLCKLMSDPAGAARLDQWGDAVWVEHVDRVCLKLKWVRYDTEGVYAGFSSSEPSFPDNHIEFDKQQYEKFLQLPLQTQEERILQVHIEEGDRGGSEFFSQGILGRLDPFDSWGSATGVVPTIPFSKVRRRLLELLAQCPAGVWFSTASLVEHLQLHDPWFLIPKDIPAPILASGMCKHRYGNFIERGREDYGNRTPISSKDPEGFAKVEGRFVERFLEGLPLVLGYTDVAYAGKGKEGSIVPSRGLLRAFRVTERLRRALSREIAPPKVTVLPNFEVHVESLFFPAATEAQLQPFGDLVQRGIVTVFRLTKAKVAAALAADPDENPLKRLEVLCGRELPSNVKHELEAWAGHSEKFILYAGFGLLEGQREAVAADPCLVEEISPHFAIVRSTEKLYRKLEALEQAPLRIQHVENTLSTPSNVRSRLAPSSPPPPAPSKKQTKIKRSVQTTLRFTDSETHAAFCKLLLDAKCVVPTDPRALTLSYPRRAEPLIKECLKKLSLQFAVTVEDVEN